MYKVKFVVFTTATQEKFTAKYNTLDECIELVKGYIGKTDATFTIYHDLRIVLSMETYDDEHNF